MAIVRSRSSSGEQLPCDATLNDHKHGISSQGCAFVDVRVGDQIYFTADGSSYAKTVVEANSWWVGFSWNEPEYQGVSTTGSVTVIRK